MTIWLAGAILAGGLAGIVTVAQGATPWNSLAGTWTRNPSLSDERPEPGPPPGPLPGGEMAPPPGEMPGGGPRMGRPPGGGPPMGGGESLVIALANDGLHVTADGRGTRVLNVDGPAVRRTRGPRAVTETVTWEPPAVVVRTAVSEGPARTERYLVDANGRLVHTVTHPDPSTGEERTLKSVYDRSANRTPTSK